MAKRFLAAVTLLRELGAGHPDQGLPGGEYPDQGLPGGGGEYPDQGLPGGGIPGLPSHPIMPVPPGGGVPSHPIYGPGEPSYPIYIPIGPEHPIAPPTSPGAPDQGLPGGGSGSKPPAIWPPLPPGSPYPEGALWLLAILPGVGWRYVRVDLGSKPDNSLPKPPSGNRPDNSLPGSGGGGGHPDQGLPRPPATGNHPDQGLPPGAAPKR